MLLSCSKLCVQGWWGALRVTVGTQAPSVLPSAILGEWHLSVCPAWHVKGARRLLLSPAAERLCPSRKRGGWWCEGMLASSSSGRNSSTSPQCLLFTSHWPETIVGDLMARDRELAPNCPSARNWAMLV